MNENNKSSGDQSAGINKEAPAGGLGQLEGPAAGGGHQEDKTNGTGDGNQGNEPPPQRFLFRLTINERLTLLLGIAALVISVLTYLNERDTSDIKGAVSNLSALALQTKREADAATAFNGVSHDNFIIDQRPWIRADFAISADWTHNSLKNGAESTQSLIDSTLINTGKTPAIFVWTHWETKVLTLHDVVAEELAECAQDRASPKKGEDIGNTIFPGQTYTERLSIGLDPSDMAAFRKLPERRRQLGLIPIFFGCVNYKSVFENQWHQTGFVFEIIRTQKATIFIKPDDIVIAKKDLALMRWFPAGKGFFAN